MFAVIALTTALTPLDPARSAVQSVAVAGRQLRLRSPDDDQVMMAIMADAHEEALAAGPDQYDEVMEDRCSTLLSERPQYWAQVWPSAVAAGARLLDDPALVANKRVLELGAGLGLASVCAALAGATTVLATDREPDSARYVIANAAENGVTVSTAPLDWTLDWTSQMDESSYDVVLAADVVYDESAPPLLARLLRSAVAPGGKVLLVDAEDRPYNSDRRMALLQLLCEERGAEFEVAQSTRSHVALKTRQGDGFEIVECVLQRRT